MKRVVIALLLALAAHGQDAAPAPPHTVKVEVLVTELRGDRVQLDAGLDKDIAVGDTVELLSPAGAPILAIVRRVALRTSEAEVLGPVLGVRRGTRGTVQVAETDEREHPPWPIDVDQWDPDAPLLAPPRGRLPEEREREVDGRWWLGYDYTSTGEGRPDHAFGQAGLHSNVRNPFGKGGELEVDVRLDARATEANEDPLPGDSTNLRIDRLSYSVGGTREESTRWEVGRFLSEEFPEFGVTDGAEWSHRIGEQDFLGLSAGFLPRENADRSTGDDTQVAAWYRHLFDPEGDLSLAAGYQKTWFEGDPDRDLVVTKLEWAPARAWRFYASAWVDLYGNDENLQESGTELTRLQSSLSWVDALAGQGMILSASRIAWPDLARDELSPILAADVLDGQVDRLDWNGWKEFGEHWRLSARADTWEDEQASGSGGELRIGLRDVLWDQGELFVAGYGSEGRYGDVTGLRLGASTYGTGSSWFVNLDLGLAEQSDFLGEQGELDIGSVRVGWETELGTDWQLSLSADQRFGEQDEATSLGITLTRYF